MSDKKRAAPEESILDKCKSKIQEIMTLENEIVNTYHEIMILEDACLYGAIETLVKLRQSHVPTPPSRRPPPIVAKHDQTIQRCAHPAMRNKLNRLNNYMIVRILPPKRQAIHDLRDVLIPTLRSIHDLKQVRSQLIQAIATMNPVIETYPLNKELRSTNKIFFTLLKRINSTIETRQGTYQQRKHQSSRFPFTQSDIKAMDI
jgi:hypothetical protein